MSFPVFGHTAERGLDVGYQETGHTQTGCLPSLYVVMDLFSRFIVAWMLSEKKTVRF